MVDRISRGNRADAECVSPRGMLTVAVDREILSVRSDPPAFLVHCSNAAPMGDGSSVSVDVSVAAAAPSIIRVRIVFDERWLDAAATRRRSKEELRRYFSGAADAPPCSVRVFILSILYNSNIEAADADAEVRGHFYDVLERSEDLGLRNILLLVEVMLEQPLHPCESCDAAWRHYAALNDARLATIERYAPLRLHPALYALGSDADDADDDAATVGLNPAWLDPTLSAALALEPGAARDTALRSLLREESPGIYSYSLLSSAMCAMLIEEVDHFQAVAMPGEVRRPNSMNNYGCVVNAMGLEGLLDALLARTGPVAPLLRLLFPAAARSVDSHHSFVVQYKLDEDVELSPHTDASHTTVNVCLGKDFEGAVLAFCGTLGEPGHRHHTLSYRHEVGRAVLHLGTRRHGARPITSGERYNLIMWCRCVAFAQSPAGRRTTLRDYAKETTAPDPICVSRVHDRDAKWILGELEDEDEDEEADVEEATKRKGKRPLGKGGGHAPWCPPRHAQYPGWNLDT